MQRKKAQSIIEYTLLFAVVAMAFLAMQIYAQRAVQANFKLIQDRVNAGP
jgi:Flp pilus assembly pilin Flp